MGQSLLISVTRAFVALIERGNGLKWGIWIGLDNASSFWSDGLVCTRVRYPTQLWFIVTGEPKLAATDQAPQRLVRYGSCAVVSACTNTVQSIVQQQELWYCMHCTAPGHQPKRF